jgi:PPOX class probable F420-dependent enzyme
LGHFNALIGFTSIICERRGGMGFSCPERDAADVTLDTEECWIRLEGSTHGALATLHPERGVDAVPVVFAVDRGVIVIPIDTVKPKRHLRLARLENLRRDGRCVLLIDHYAEDWSDLWWVRVHATAQIAPDPTDWVDALAVRFPPYRQPATVAAVVLLRPTAITGWAAR